MSAPSSSHPPPGGQGRRKRPKSHSGKGYGDRPRKRTKEQRPPCSRQEEYVEEDYSEQALDLVKKLYGFPFPCKDLSNITKITTTKKKYLKPSDIDEKSDVWIVKSPMGSGKTTVFLDLARRFSRVMVISCRRTYSDYICSVAEGMMNYQNIRGSINASDHPKVVVQVQSLKRIREIKTSTIHAQWQVLYIDEPDGVFKELVSGVTDLSDRRDQINYLVKLFSCIPKVVVSDAGLAPWHLSLIRSHLLSDLSFKSMSCLINTYAPKTHHVRVFDRCVLSHTYYEKVFLKKGIRKALGDNSCFLDIDFFLLGKRSSAAIDFFVDAIVYRAKKKKTDNKDLSIRLLDLIMNTKDKNVVVICNTKTQAYLVDSVARRVFSKNHEDSVILLTGDSPPDLRKKVLADPKEALGRCRVFIYTTMFKVGVDLNFDHFDEIFLIVDSLSEKFTPTLIDLFQSVGRSRVTRVLNLYVAHPHKKKKGETTREKTTTDCGPFPIDLSLGAAGDQLDHLIHKINKVERAINRSPGLFKAVLLKLLECTIMGSIEEFKTPPTDEEADDDELMKDEEMMKLLNRTCVSIFDARISKYTTLTMHSFNELFSNRTQKERKETLQQIRDVMYMVDGSIKNSLYIVRHLNKHNLKHWAVNFEKLVDEDPTTPVNVLRFDEEAAAIYDPEKFVDKVYATLYSNCRVTNIRDRETFKRVMVTLKQMLDHPVPDHRTDDLLYLGKIFIDEYDPPEDPRSIMTAVCEQTGLTLVDNVVVMPVRPEVTCDIHKMAAMLLI